MSDLLIAELAILILFLLILGGVHVAFALALTGFLAVVLLRDIDIALSLVAQAASSGIEGLVFAVIPLFILMGAFMTNSRLAHDLYALMNLLVRRIKGGLAVATVFANAAFAATTGITLASATIFSTIAYPEMRRYRYSNRLALGTIAGSSVLGMLIPPSVLLILYGILTQISIGSLFIAGIIPGLILAGLYSFGILIIVWLRPQLAEEGPVAVGKQQPQSLRWQIPNLDRVPADPLATAPSVHSEAVTRSAGEHPGTAESESLAFWQLFLRSGSVVLLFVLIIGGLWGGVFTPTEAGAVGAFGALLIALATGMRWRGIVNSFKSTATITGSILLLLIAAKLYSIMLAASGIVDRLGRLIISLEVPTLAVLGLFLFLLLVLGCLLDSSSILLITVPLMAPVIAQLSVDPLWFGIIAIVAVEVGIITPPFGMVPFAMSGVLGEEAKLSDIFVGALPFVLTMLALIALLISFPILVTWLPAQM